MRAAPGRLRRFRREVVERLPVRELPSPDDDDSIVVVELVRLGGADGVRSRMAWTQRGKTELAGPFERLPAGGMTDRVAMTLAREGHRGWADGGFRGRGRRS